MSASNISGPDGEPRPDSPTIPKTNIAPNHHSTDLMNADLNQDESASLRAQKYWASNSDSWSTSATAGLGSPRTPLFGRQAFNRTGEDFIESLTSNPSVSTNPSPRDHATLLPEEHVAQWKQCRNQKPNVPILVRRNGQPTTLLSQINSIKLGQTHINLDNCEGAPFQAKMDMTNALDHLAEQTGFAGEYKMFVMEEAMKSWEAER
ncbi:hypothetical protein OEA41_009689 [Lepraria neglecta]|uniref:Uncharacterized protein n=1 Tax=Lepraria neglecta TaxID=209136 RepID=A0AAD9Z5D5_9LECA|nr:hypothetical protein OEA41_009689 [Lepraria neglecta]